MHCSPRCAATPNQPAMAWASPPAALAGGFWAEMYVDRACPIRTPELEGRLVARIMPDPATAAFETAVQRHLTRCGFPVPAIRCADGPSSDLDRAWSVMDFATGQPLLAGLSAGSAIKQAPTLLRRLPDLLAEAAAALHRCPTDGLHSELGDHGRQPDIHDFLERIAAQADAIGRRRPGANRRAPRRDHARHAASSATAISTRSTCSSTDDRWTLIDWSTAVLADPHYDLAFTTLMLANPPLGGPAPLRAATRAIGTRLANRFLRSYEQQSRTQRRSRTGSPGVAAPTRYAPWSRSPPGKRTTPRRPPRTSLADDAPHARTRTRPSGYSSLCLSTR